MTELQQLSRLVPEWEDLFRLRYGILKEIAARPGTGRRQLTKTLGQTERRIRNEIENLTRFELLESTPQGLRITQLGNQVMYQLESIAAAQGERQLLEQALEERLAIQRVRIGSSQEEVGQLALCQFMGLLDKVTVLGVTGGTAIRLLIDKVGQLTRPDLTVVPARGSLGQATAIQANTLAEDLARKLDSHFYPLIAIDHLQHATREQMQQEPLIKRTLKQLDRLDGLIFGIGRADDMMARRNLPTRLVKQLTKAGAVAEALGNFYNQAGELVYELETIGVHLEHVKNLDVLMAIAYGENKAQAVISVSHINPNIILVTDEACAREMFTLLGGNNGKSSN